MRFRSMSLRASRALLRRRRPRSRCRVLPSPQLGERPVYDPSVPFAVHTTPGASLDLLVAGAERRAAAFQPTDDALSAYVIVDFDAFDAWFEEDERNVGHPRDPFHRIEIVHSSRSVRVERDGALLAASSRPHLLFEAPLPVRYYLPPEDVREGVCGRAPREPSAPRRDRPPIGRRSMRTTLPGAIPSLSARRPR